MTPSTDSSVKKFIEDLHLPGLSHSLGSVSRVLAADLSDGHANVEIELGFPADSVLPDWQRHIAEALRDEIGATETDVKLTTSVTAHGVQRNLKPLSNVRNVIAVASAEDVIVQSTPKNIVSGTADELVQSHATRELVIAGATV